MDEYILMAFLLGIAVSYVTGMWFGSWVADRDWRSAGERIKITGRATILTSEERRYVVLPLEVYERLLDCARIRSDA